MGSFFQSLHIRSDDADAVEAAAHRVARKEGLKMLVAPARKGWVNVYPPTDNWLPRIAAALAKACKAEHAILFAVHDSDVLQYWYYRRGTLKDRFVSCPDYFGKASKGDMDAVGDAEAFAELLPDRKARARLKRIISGRLINGEYLGEVPDFEDDRLAAIAKVFGIDGALGSYEMLKAGESVKGVGKLRGMKEVG